MNLMNNELFRLINNLAYKSKVLDSIMIFFSKYVIYIYMLIVAGLFVKGIIQKKSSCRKAAFSAFAIAAVNLILNFIIGHIYYVDRPFVHNKVNVLVPHKANASFPSDHSAGTMSIALGLGKYRKILGVILMVMSFIVGFSRVYVGNHYPMDVIGAYIIVVITNYIYNLKFRKKLLTLYEEVENKIVEAVFKRN